MLRGLYLSATNMMLQRKKVDVITNNIANMDTTGYKADSLISRSFEDLLLHRVGGTAADGSVEVGNMNTGVHIDEVITSFEEGSLEPTDRTADLAISGDGFFAVSTTAGERYTRDGSFTLNSEGYLTTADGNRVAGKSGFIKVTSPDFKVDEKGNVTNADGTNAGTLKIVSFADTTGLKKVGNGLFINETNQPVKTADKAVVRQGYLESSNTDITSEMLELMSASRTYETSQRMVKMIDETLGRAVSEIGKV